MAGRNVKDKMAKSLVTEPNSTWNPNDIPGWRREQFSALGFKGDLLDFLSESRVDSHAVGRLISQGCEPLLALRIEAGNDHAGADATFDHAKFDELVLGDVDVADSVPDDWFELPEPPTTIGGVLTQRREVSS